jgi:hypothetical protein
MKDTAFYLTTHEIPRVLGAVYLEIEQKPYMFPIRAHMKRHILLFGYSFGLHKVFPHILSSFNPIWHVWSSISLWAYPLHP